VGHPDDADVDVGEHEFMTPPGEPTDPPPRFEAAYAGTPPWDIGRPQPGFIALAEAGVVAGRVMDVGCGTGEHTLMAAGMGLEAVGIDSAPTQPSIERAARPRIATWPPGSSRATRSPWTGS
jgi:SAM-dependent methyltransferase